MKRMTTLLCAALMGAAAAQASTDEVETRLNALATGAIAQWAQSAEMRSAIEAQNRETAGYSQERIDTLDKTWRDQTVTGGDLIDEVLSNALSAQLKQRKASGEGQFTEIFVVDAVGLNVGQSDMTSDYWQGDEAKWQVPFETGGFLIGEIEFDESAQSYQSQISVPVKDPADDRVIGVIVVGVDIDRLAQAK